MLDDSARLEAINSDFFDRYLAMQVIASSRACRAELLKGFEEHIEQVRILAVMIPGGPYVEDVERRIRSRRAVVEGLGVAGYAPEREHEIGYFCVPWHPLEPTIANAVRALEENRRNDEWFSLAGIHPIRRNLQAAQDLPVPYEWYEPAKVGSEKSRHVLVVWLTDAAFRDAPIARLADFISWLRLGCAWLSSTNAGRLPLPVVTLLGPDNSGTLRRMVEEAETVVWDQDTRESLATTHIYSSQASAAENQLLPPKTRDQNKNCKNLLESGIKSSQSDSQFSFERTIPLDDRVVEVLLKELKNRQVRPGVDNIAIISEEDTYYARALRQTFIDKCPAVSARPTIHMFTYLRGIDGKLPSDKNDETEKKAAESGDTKAQSVRRTKERPEGVNQADDIRRLACTLQDLEKQWSKNGEGGFKAVGVLGSDVYDKLELLKALRPVLPGAVFFTNNLDARFAHPDEWGGTHNLIVASSLDLSPPRADRKACSLSGENADQSVPPFRDSAQTALFEATLRAVRDKPIENGSDPTPACPRIFEIGRSGPKELGISTSEGSWWSQGVPSVADSKASHGPRMFLSLSLYVGGLFGMGLLLFFLGSEVRFTLSHLGDAFKIALTIAASGVMILGIFTLFREDLPRLLRICYFVVFGSGLLVWKYLVSRVTSARRHASSETESAVNRIPPGSKAETNGLSAWLWDQRHEIAASTWLAVPICATLTVGFVWYFYHIQNSSGAGEPFAWFDGISAWPSIAIILFAGLLSIHFLLKAHFILRKNASELTKKFGLQDTMPDKISFFGWEKPPLKPAIAPKDPEDRASKRIDIAALWQRYLRRGQLWMRVLRAAPMTVIYLSALLAILPIVGNFSPPPIRGPFAGYFIGLMMTTIVLFLFLTFFIIDAILLHEGFLNQLKERESCWPDATFKNFNYKIQPDRPPNQSDLADYWDILLIARRTEAVGGLIYYPFIILSLLILARLSYFDNWNWPPVLILTFSLHFALALYAAWRLPEVAREYRDKVLERLKRRKRQALMLAKESPQAIETMIEEVQSTHQGAFSSLWEQPAIRALLFPSSGIGIATLLQYLPH